MRPVLVRDRAFFVAIEVGDNFFRRGDFRRPCDTSSSHSRSIPATRRSAARVQMCRPFCPPVVVVPVVRPRMVVLPFAEFRDPFAVVTTIPPGLGLWTAEAIAPYFSPYYDIVGTGELYLVDGQAWPDDA